MAIKTVCLCICAILLFICYRAQWFAEKVLKKEPEERLVLKIKTVALVISIILLLAVLIFIR